MSDAIWVAIIGAVGMILVTRLNTMQNRKLGKSISEVKEHSEAVREQVENTHTRNLRDDVDRLTDKVVEGFAGIESRQDALADRATAGFKVFGEELKAQKMRLDNHIDNITEDK
jgi:hypothetical protein